MSKARCFLALVHALALVPGIAWSTDESIHFLVPGAPGGGWDRTARGVGSALLDAGLVGRATFENRSGGGGAKAIAYLIERRPPETLMVNSTPIVVRALRGVFPQSFRDLTPIASVIGDYSVIAVRAQSDVRRIDTLAARMHAEPRSVAIAGGSVYGSTDHIVAGLVFDAMGIPAGQVKYIPYDAGGKAMAGLLSGEVDALSSGLGEVIDLAEQGYVRILCTVSAARLSVTPEVATCAEQGAIETEFVNWRGFFGPPSMSADEADAYRALLADLVQTKVWENVRNRYGWVDLFRAGDAFTALLENQESELARLMIDLELIE